MQNENNISKKHIILLLSIGTIAIWMFRVEDPYKLLLLVLLMAWVYSRPILHFSRIDAILAGICLFDIVNWCLHPFSGMEVAYGSTTCFIGYLLLRSALNNEHNINIFLKAFCFPASVALCIALLSFAIFKNSIYAVGFNDTYPFRFLFKPLGYVTNAYSVISFLLLVFFTIGYIKVKKWHYFFGGLWVCCSIMILLSFSRGAYIAWGIYIVATLLIIISWKKKLYFLVTCICISGLAWLLFPVETSTTCSMNKTVLQRQSTEGRLLATESALNIFKNNKWLGAGNGNYTLVMDKDIGQDSRRSYTSYAPNIIVQLLIERGIIGLSMYIYLFVVTGFTIWKQRRHTITLVIGGVLLSICVKELTMSVILNELIVQFLLYTLLVFLQIEGSDSKEQGEILAKNLKHILLISGSLCFVGCEAYSIWHMYNENYNIKSIIAFKKKNYKEAIGWIEQTPEQTPYLVNRLMLGVNIPDSLMSDYWPCLERTLGLLNQRVHEDIYIDYLHAKVLKKKGEIKNAYALLQILVEDYPQNAIFQYELFSLLYDMGEKSKAISHLEKALWLFPRLVHMPRVTLLKETSSCFASRTLKNITYYQISDRHTPDWYARYGYLTYYIGDKKDAESLLKKAIEDQPNFSTPWLLLGKLNELKGQGQEAACCFKKYTLLNKGAFANFTKDVVVAEQNISEEEILFSLYAIKFRSWYQSDLLF